MPCWLVYVVLALSGLALHALYAYVTHVRWGATWADPGTVLLHRCNVDSSWPFKEQALHGLLWSMKRVGWFMIVFGVGFLVAGIFYDHSLLRQLPW